MSASSKKKSLPKSTKKSSKPKNKKKDGRSAPKGNKNAWKHGLYSKAIREDERVIYAKMLNGEYSFEEEESICRMRLRRAVLLDFEQDEWIRRTRASEEQEFKEHAVIDSLKENIEGLGITDGEGQTAISIAKKVEKTIVSKIIDYKTIIHNITLELVKIRNIRLIAQGLDPMDKDTKKNFVRATIDTYKTEIYGDI